MKEDFLFITGIIIGAFIFISLKSLIAFGRIPLLFDFGPVKSLLRGIGFFWQLVIGAGFAAVAGFITGKMEERNDGKMS